VSLPREGELTVPVFETVLHGISVIGSIVGTREDLAEVFRLHALGRTTVIAQTRSLEDVEQSMHDVLNGTVPARVVFEFGRDHAHHPVALSGSTAAG
jgi:propanol-preferring alcohol dehydrogenase